MSDNIPNLPHCPPGVEMPSTLLSSADRTWRAVLSVAILAGMAVLRWGGAGLVGAVASHPLSQQVFGIPCPFCGMTRGTSAVLRGEWQQALYLNSASFAVIACAFLLASVWIVEACLGRRWTRFARFTSALLRRPFLLLGLLGLFWIFHLTSALRQPKPELLTPTAPLFPAFLLEPHP